MPMWRCPHCGTPQAETARCWVCRRSSTACGTCRHFRRSVAADLGYCGLDRRRRPLAGDEIRACWEGGPLTTSETPRTAHPVVLDRPGTRLDFVDVETGTSRRSKRPAPGAGAAAVAVAGARDGAGAAAVDDLPSVAGRPVHGEPGWSLWGDLDT